MPRQHTSDLTSAHSRILHVLASLLESGRQPSVADLVQELGFAGETSVTPTLKIMQRNGFIEIYGGGKRGRRRTITLTTKGKAIIGIDGLRVVGSIPAGSVEEVISQCETIIEYHELLDHKPGDFLLIVKGDSMIGDGILPGDKVLLRPNIQVKNGEIAAIHVGNEFLATLKHVHFSSNKNKVTLKASNPNYKDIVAPAKDVKIAGVYRGLVRNYHA